MESCGSASMKSKSAPSADVSHICMRIYCDSLSARINPACLRLRDFSTLQKRCAGIACLYNVDAVFQQACTSPLCCVSRSSFQLPLRSFRPTTMLHSERPCGARPAVLCRRLLFCSFLCIAQILAPASSGVTAAPHRPRSNCARSLGSPAALH